MTLPPISKRLLSAIPFVREGSFLADVGTDHAYLPLYLCLTGKIRGAVAADVREGPLSSAKANIKAYGLADKIETCLSDGLLKLAPFAPEDVSIFGMGGELIASIMAAVDWTKDGKLRFILQPMTKTESLRAYLAREGFAILDETLTKEDGRIYQTLSVAFDGKNRTLSPLALLVGEKNLERGGELLAELLLAKQKTFTEILAAKRAAGLDTEYERTVLAEIESYLKEKTL
ncbi:MAG: SAM-dependent methyltransferase [Ruminococcaceae bacterium]|nr:SAM-dependent methyltransferase [Oscillospiraceae bacterium]